MAIKRQWLSRVGGVDVVRVTDVKRSGQPSSLSVPPKGVLHTTEGGRAGSISVFRNSTGTPTFGSGRAEDGQLHVDQFIPIGEMALTLKNLEGGTETNREALVQIEVYGFSRKDKPKAWPLMVNRQPFDEESKNLLADLVREASEAADIPLRHAGLGFLNRSLTAWDTKAGWFAHSEVPENDHWDVGTLPWDDLLRRAQRFRVFLSAKVEGERKVIAITDPVRGNEVRSRYTKFIAGHALKFARLAVQRRAPRFGLRRVA